MVQYHAVYIVKTISVTMGLPRHKGIYIIKTSLHGSLNTWPRVYMESKYRSPMCWVDVPRDILTIIAGFPRDIGIQDLGYVILIAPGDALY